MLANSKSQHIHLVQNIPSNLQQRRLRRILTTLNNLPTHNILNKRLNSLSRIFRTTNSKHQLPIDGNGIPTKNRGRNVRGFLSLELSHSRAHRLRVYS
jgi:hypothetical protein